jgi:hypothetical protein
MPLDNNETVMLRVPWLSMSAVVVLAAALLVWFRPDLRPREVAGPFLRAAPQGDSLRITWPAGEAAALSIQQGGGWHGIALSRQALADGQLLYRPSSSDVLVRLDHSGASETLRLIGLPAHASPAGSEPAADRAPAPPPEIPSRKIPVLLPQAVRSIHGNVRVDVQVVIAADGSVRSAVFLKRAESPYFNRLSLAAAQASRFPSMSGHSLVLRYDYTRAGVEVSQPAR